MKYKYLQDDINIFQNIPPVNLIWFYSLEKLYFYANMQHGELYKQEDEQQEVVARLKKETEELS